MITQNQRRVRMWTRTRDDFQSIRKKMDNRRGIKADGTGQDIKDERQYTEEDMINFARVSKAAKDQEEAVEKTLEKALRQFPIYTEWLKPIIKGVGTVVAGWLIGEFDVTKGTVSKWTQYAGLNSGMVRGKKRIDVDKYKAKDGEIVKTLFDENDEPEAYIVLTNTMVRGDKLTPGFVSPFNSRLRAALMGVLASGFIKSKSQYALEYYHPYKARLEQSENTVTHRKKEVAWKDVSKGHRDMAAKRYMIKMFLQDLWIAWRKMEGLSVGESYAEKYLGRKHNKDA